MSRALIYLGSGKCSVFGGPSDAGVAEGEGLALFEESDRNALISSGIALPARPTPRAGLARSLNPAAFYCASRWNYSAISRDELRRGTVLFLRGRTLCEARAVDWGPHARTGRIFDLSPGLAQALNVETDETASAWFLPAK